MKIPLCYTAIVIFTCCALFADTNEKKSDEPSPQVIFIGDAIRLPGAISYTKDLRFATALLKGGGVLQKDAPFKDLHIYLIRSGKTKKMNIQWALDVDDDDKNFALEPWDIISVSR